LIDLASKHVPLARCFLTLVTPDEAGPVEE
jgi:hypothetical protein